MLNIQNSSFITDVVRLPKEVLQQMCTDLGIPDAGSVTDLANEIWEQVRDNQVLRNVVLGTGRERLLAGRTSVAWFRPANGCSLEGARARITQNAGFDPFARIRNCSANELTSTPVLMTAGTNGDDSKYYLRLMLRTGVSRVFNGTEMERRPRTSIITAYVDEQKGIIETRCEPKFAERIASTVTALVGDTVVVDPIPFCALYDRDASRIADALSGELIDTMCTPELLLEEFGDEQRSAVLNILNAVDTYFRNPEIELLGRELTAAMQNLSPGHVALGFTALILAGLEKVGMGVSGRDLRGLPLYDSLRPFLSQTGGFIQFEHADNRVTHTYTIRVGLQSDSVFFMTPATESVIEYVRERLLP